MGRAAPSTPWGWRSCGALAGAARLSLQRRVPSHPRPVPASVTSGNVGADLEETVKEMRPRGLRLQVREASCCRASHRQRGTCRPFLNVRNESFAQV